jgi:hypothetical protein
MENRIIIWEKWIDPFFPEEEVDTEELEEDYEPRGQQRGPVGRILVSPMGVISVNEHHQASKVFWVGHTNFDIGPKERDIIEQIPGVETLDIWTRYRFRIAVAQAFVPSTVMHNIATHLCPVQVVVSKKQRNIDDLKNHLSEKYLHWAIVILPNGKMDCEHGESIQDVEDKIAKYTEAEIVKSWEGTDEGKVNTKRSDKRGIQHSFSK